MTRRFRMVAGPNGSGKTTLVSRLASEYSVNFYTMLNADDVFAHVKKEMAFFTPMPIDNDKLLEYVKASQYSDEEKSYFLSGDISTEDDCIRFHNNASVNSYTVAMLVNFLQDEFINGGISFSQETVFSHHSKITALKKAHEAGFRTYLYYVATTDPFINAQRVVERYALGGHNVPPDKIMARYARSIENAKAAIPYLSRAFFFDNSGSEMRYLASYTSENGFVPNISNQEFPEWFRKIIGTNGKMSQNLDMEVL